MLSFTSLDILETSSQVTRWYPLDGGIGFGRIRIALLFRSIETRLPPQMLGWDVGTFEFQSQRILAVGYNQHPKLRMRTGGSTFTLKMSRRRKNTEVRILADFACAGVVSLGLFPV